MLGYYFTVIGPLPPAHQRAIAALAEARDVRDALLLVALDDLSPELIREAQRFIEREARTQARSRALFNSGRDAYRLRW